MNSPSAPAKSGSEKELYNSTGKSESGVAFSMA
jgi:hypothetical protein